MTLRTFIYGEDGFNNIVLTNSLSMLGIDIIGEVDSEIVALREITHHSPDVVVLQIDLGQLKAIELAITLRKRFPNLGIVLATKATDIRLIGVEKRDLPIGVLVSQISKHSDLDNLKAAIIQSINCTTCEPEFHICDFLSDVQVETFRMMAAGNANSEIAKMRFVSEKSIEQMLARIALSLGLIFDHKYNSRVRLLNSYYELVNGRM
jgi:DNA-binding NarL/FixJ family response regulator